MTGLLPLLLATLCSGSGTPSPTDPVDESARGATRITIGGLSPRSRVLLSNRWPDGFRVLDFRSDAHGSLTLTLLVPAPAPPLATSPSPTFHPGASALLGPQVPAAGRGPDAQAFSFDSFSGNSLSPAWQVLNPSTAEVTVSGGELHLRPLLTGSAATWFADGEGVFVHRLVTGNFTARTRARATSVSDPEQPPPAQYRLGGLLVRDPASAPGARNSLHLALGAGDNVSPVAVEDKTTTDSTSTFFFHDVAEPNCELRIRRNGAIFTLEYRASTGSPWLLARVMSRPDLPQTLEIGLMAYSFEAGADLRVSFSNFLLQSSL